MKLGDGARKVLDALDSGAPVERPHAPLFTARPIRCRYCQRHALMLALWPSGKLAVLEPHPEGEVVIVQGTAVTWGPHHGMLERFASHFLSCEKAPK